jgi:hypothetical protein
MPRLSFSIRMNLKIVGIVLIFSFAFGFCVAPTSSAIDKLTVEELLAGHLRSIGPEESRASNRIIAGTSQVIFRTAPSGQAIGKAVLASDGVKTLIGMSFPSPIYPREQLGFDGNTFTAAFATPGNRSILGNFLMTNEIIFKQGLMGGTLSSAWPLLDLSSRRAQLEYVGTKKIDGRVLHEVKYLPHGTTDVKTTIYFSENTFEHVRTEYDRVIPAPMGKVEYTNVHEREGRYKMIEEFSLFKPEGGLNLPHIYTIKLSVDTVNGTFLAEWTIKLTNFEFNQKIDPDAFRITGG